MKNNLKKINCTNDSCSRKFGNNGALARHVQSVHPYVPPPAPIKKTSVIPQRLLKQQNLEGALKKIELGDTLYIVDRFVVKQITSTEGSETVEAGLEYVSGYWTKNKPV
jgi:hypothetical protein